MQARYSTDDWFIDEHRTKKRDALFPGTGFLTLAAQALRAQGEGDTFSIRDMTFMRPLYVPDDGYRDMRLRLSRRDHGYQMKVFGDCRLDGQNGFAPTVAAEISLTPQATPSKLDLATIRI